METNKIDNNIKEQFENRTFKPSASAWERLSVQLDEEPKQKKIGWFFYIGAAASILLLVSIGIQLFSDDSQEIIPNEEVVISPIDTNNIDTTIEKFINEIHIEEAIVKKDKVENSELNNEEFKNSINSNIIVNKSNNVSQTKKEYKERVVKKQFFEKKHKTILAKVEEKMLVAIQKKEVPKENKILKQDPNSSIKINSDDLLFAVTHSPEEVTAYYAKYNVNREDVLKTIRNQLKESNIKINPNTILAEVERTIDDDVFQNNFMKTLKRRVSDIATAIASRNN